jgi:TolB-like protein/predicted Zn-dependent protease
VTETALRTAKAVVVLWSPRSVVSRWVRAEATLADRNKTLVPCTIEPCDRPIMFELTQTAELSHWQGEPTDKAWQAFLDDVRRMAAKAVPPAPQTPATTAEPPTVEETLKPGQSGSAPSLAVLPFTNRSGLPDDEAFAELMVEDVISALSQGVNVRVLGASATANLSRTAITDLAALGRQLGVRYLLEGNLRRVGANLRVTTQLLEAATGTVMWTGKFDRPLSELAALEEELVTDIAASLDTQVYALEMERALKKPSDITAWEALARAMSFARGFDAAYLQRARQEIERAVAIAPDYAPAVACLAATMSNAYAFGPDDPVEVQRIRAFAERALALAPDDADVLNYVGEALLFTGFAEEAERYTARAVRKAPGSGFMHLMHSNSSLLLGRGEEALSHANTAERLMPGSVLMWAVKLNQARALWMLGRLAEAAAAADASLQLDPTGVFANMMKALISLQLGRESDALAAAKTLQRAGHEWQGLERLLRRFNPKGSEIEAEIPKLRAIWDSAEPNG